MFKFSILLPTKDRLELLKYAVKSVQIQEYTNWEIIISDNCSSMDVKSWVQELHDKIVAIVEWHVVYYEGGNIAECMEQQIREFLGGAYGKDNNFWSRR